MARALSRASVHFQKQPHVSVNIHNGCYYCHKCHSKGNQLELWAAVTGLRIYPATIDLCHSLGHEIPWITRW